MALSAARRLWSFLSLLLLFALRFALFISEREIKRGKGFSESSPFGSVPFGLTPPRIGVQKLPHWLFVLETSKLCTKRSPYKLTSLS